MSAIFYLYDTFKVTGRGTVITGRIMEGVIDKGDIIIIGGKYLKITGIEMFTKAFTTAQSGDNVGILLGYQTTKEEMSAYRKTKLIIVDISEIREEKLREIGID